MLAKEPSHGYQLRARLTEALGPLGDAMNAGQIYVTLDRLEKGGLGAPLLQPRAHTAVAAARGGRREPRGSLPPRGPGGRGGAWCPPSPSRPPKLRSGRTARCTR